MPKVLRIINRFNIGGPTHNAVLLTRFLEPDFETLLIGGDCEESERNSLFLADEYKVKPLIISKMKRSLGLRNDIAAFREICKIIDTFNPDIVHTHASKAGAIGRFAAFRKKVPVVVHTFHGHVFDSYFGKIKTRVIVKIERWLAKRTNAIIAISEKQKSELVFKYQISNSDKVKMVPLGFDLSKFQQESSNKRKLFRNEFQVKEDEILVSIIGRLVPIKNHMLFIEAIHYVKLNSDKRVRAFIVGDGEMRNELQAFARKLKLCVSEFETITEKSDIVFTSWRKDIDSVLAGSDILALTSLNEGTPVSLIEAQAMGVPIVSTNVGGIENVVIPGKTALLSPKESKIAFFENLISLVEDEQLRKEMSGLGWQFVKERFHYQRLCEDVKALYAELMTQIQ